MKEKTTDLSKMTHRDAKFLKKAHALREKSEVQSKSRFWFRRIWAARTLQKLKKLDEYFKQRLEECMRATNTVSFGDGMTPCYYFFQKFEEFQGMRPLIGFSDKLRKAANLVPRGPDKAREVERISKKFRTAEDCRLLEEARQILIDHPDLQEAPAEVRGRMLQLEEHFDIRMNEAARAHKGLCSASSTTMNVFEMFLHLSAAPGEESSFEKMARISDAEYAEAIARNKRRSDAV